MVEFRWYTMYKCGRITVVEIKGDNFMFVQLILRATLKQTKHASVLISICGEMNYCTFYISYDLHFDY